MLTALFAINDHTDVYVATTGQVLIAIITTAGVVACSILAVMLPGRFKAKRERKESRLVQDAIHEQVANTHETNLRDDVDQIGQNQDRTDRKVDEVITILHKLVARQDRASGDIGKVKAVVETVKTDVLEVKETVSTLDGRLTDHIDGR